MLATCSCKHRKLRHVSGTSGLVVTGDARVNESQESIKLIEKEAQAQGSINSIDPCTYA